MERNTVEAMAKEAPDSKRNLKTDFNKKWGTIKKAHYYNAQDAIKAGEDVCLVGTNKASDAFIIKGDEIKEWGLNIDSLLVKNEMELYEREIL